ncbi:MAG: toxin-antitoxin system HicB family antitoxin [Acidobacteriota bacterium]|jgi:plasmid stability protein|nr:toxin-antitoxin system HicB family antitoxin [Acidobacteriota bacterium]
MPAMIQLRNVPDELHRKLKARAAAEGLSLSAYILRDAAELAERPSSAEWLQMARNLRPLKLKETPAETIRKMRDGR